MTKEKYNAYDEHSKEVEILQQTRQQQQKITRIPSEDIDKEKKKTQTNKHIKRGTRQNGGEIIGSEEHDTRGGKK